MTLRDANCKVEQLNNDLDTMLRNKEILECMVEPSAVDTTKIMVDGGKHCNMFEVYVETKDLDKWKNLEKNIKKTQEEIENYINWIDKELKILNKYRKVEQLIVYYKEIAIKDYTWASIGLLVHYSKEQCQRIYKNYKEKRYYD